MWHSDTDSEKFPEVLQFANARHQFEAPTEANFAWLWDLLCASGWVPGPGDTPRDIWEEVGPYQPMLIRWLERMIAKPPDLIAGRVVVEKRCRYGVAKLVLSVRSEASSIPQTIPIHDLLPKMSPQARVRIVSNETPPPEYDVPQDVLSSPGGPPPLHPLHVLYRQLTAFFQENAKRWYHKCPNCERFFRPLTARAQAYCSDACWGEAHPISPEANRGYQRTSRALWKCRKLEHIEKAIHRVYARLTGQKPGRADGLTLEDVPADVLVDYVIESVRTQANRSLQRKFGPRVRRKLRIGPKECRKFMNSPDLSRRAQGQIAELTRGAMPQDMGKA
jgi:hypothetical protein